MCALVCGLCHSIFRMITQSDRWRGQDQIDATTKKTTLLTKPATYDLLLPNHRRYPIYPIYPTAQCCVYCNAKQRKTNAHTRHTLYFCRPSASDTSDGFEISASFEHTKPKCSTAEWLVNLKCSLRTEWCLPSFTFNIKQTNHFYFIFIFCFFNWMFDFERN